MYIHIHSEDICKRLIKMCITMAKANRLERNKMGLTQRSSQRIRGNKSIASHTEHKLKKKKQAKDLKKAHGKDAS